MEEAYTFERLFRYVKGSLVIASMITLFLYGTVLMLSLCVNHSLDIPAEYFLVMLSLMMIASLVCLILYLACPKMWEIKHAEKGKLPFVLLPDIYIIVLAVEDIGTHKYRH